MKQLIIGGARSGKSRLAKAIAMDWQHVSDGNITLIVTANPDGIDDSEMSKRIVHHQMNCPSSWNVVQASTDLAGAITQAQDDNTLIVIDCLTLWLANELREAQSTWTNAKTDFMTSVIHCRCPLIMIGNEVGQGVVPMGNFNRTFVDELGWLHQHIGAISDSVTMCIAGLPMVLKSPLQNQEGGL